MAHSKRKRKANRTEAGIMLIVGFFILVTLATGGINGFKDRFIGLIVLVVLVAICVGCIYLIYVVIRRTRANQPPQNESIHRPDISVVAYPYQSRPSILTQMELSFFKVLRPMVEGQWHIFTKVRMEDIIEVKEGLEQKEAYGFRSRIKSRHIDFVICDKTTLEILMCVELDDSSHQTEKAQEIDAFKDKAMKDAGVALIRIPAKGSYSEAYIRDYLFEEEELEPVAQSEANAVDNDPDARWRSPADVKIGRL